MDRVVIAVDGETRVPLRVQVFSTEMTDPAFEVGFTSVDFATPDRRRSSPSRRRPAPTVTEHTASGTDAMTGHSGTASLTTPSHPTVVGTGWSQVVVAHDADR